MNSMCCSISLSNLNKCVTEPVYMCNRLIEWLIDGSIDWYLTLREQAYKWQRYTTIWCCDGPKDGSVNCHNEKGVGGDKCGPKSLLTIGLQMTALIKLLLVEATVSCLTWRVAFFIHLLSVLRRTVSLIRYT